MHKRVNGRLEMMAKCTNELVPGGWKWWCCWANHQKSAQTSKWVKCTGSSAQTKAPPQGRGAPQYEHRTSKLSQSSFSAAPFHQRWGAKSPRKFTEEVLEGNPSLEKATALSAPNPIKFPCFQTHRYGWAKPPGMGKSWGSQSLQSGSFPDNRNPPPNASAAKGKPKVACG